GKVGEREHELRAALQELFGISPRISCSVREAVAGAPETVEDDPPLSEEEALARLTAICPKSAQRLAFHLVKAPAEEAKRLAEAILQAKERIFFCKECGNVAEGDLCRICRDESRDRTVLCVVEEPKDAATIERAGVVRGRYHVLGGAISPLDGIGPDDLRVQELL